jgi:FAD/FMN-containing dehydrogenase
VVQALDTLADVFAGEIIVPSHPGYDEARRIWNAMADRRPALVVRPTSNEDVAAALRFARERELVVAVRGGGHSIPGLSTCDGGIVIDLCRLNGIRVDPRTRRAVAGGGAHLGDLDDAAQAHELVCPVGTVSHTGVAGLTLGGGMGRLQRKFGLTIDNLAGVELVSADGRVVRAGKDENPELFWGMRGAGSNFGIVTSFEFALNPLDPVITHGSVVHPIERAGDLAAVFREVAAAAPNELWLTLDIGRAGLEGGPAAPATATVSVMHCGSESDATRDVADLQAFGTPEVDSIVRKTYVESQHLNDETDRWGHRFYMKSAFIPSLPDEVVNAAVEHALRVPPGIDGTLSAWTWGGAIADVPDEATAFTGRDASFWLSAEVRWDDPALDGEARDWGRSLIAAAAPFAVTGRYVNDVAEPGEELRTIYGAEKYERLVALKREWDPDNVFRLNLNIQP